MVDPVVNKGKVTVSTGYNDTATSIVLATGQGAELPDPVVDGAYNLPWWDSTNYNDPADDPNFEIVRVTGPAGTGDTKTIVRAQEGTAATNKNNADATYKMHLGVTAKTITDITDTVQIDSINNEVGIGTAPVSGSSLALSSHNDAATPTLSFGDGDTGFYESADDVFQISIGGTTHFRFDGSSFRGETANGPSMINEVATATNPSIIPANGDYDTGIGWATSNQLSLIAGGLECVRIIKSGTVTKTTQINGRLTTPTTQTLTGAGAVDLDSAMTLIVTTAADALTLADGVEGQEKFIVMKTDANDGTLTPAHLKNGTTITFDDVGDSAHLIFMDGDWVFMGGTATLA